MHTQRQILDDPGIAPSLTEPCDVAEVSGVWRRLATEGVMFPMKSGDLAMRIGHERQLFVDNALIASATDVTRQVHQPEPCRDRPVLAADENDFRVQVLHVLQFDQAPRFRMWYWSGQNWHDWGDREETRFATSYAVSDDGLEWPRPQLGLHAIDGWPEKNIVIPYGHMHGLFHEPWEADPARRFKALVCVERRNRDTGEDTIREGYYLHTSPDGIHWTGDLSRCLIPSLDGYAYPQSGVGDTTRFWWDPYRRRYIGDVKFVIPRKQRCRGIMESDDLVHWSRPVPTLFGREEGQQIYGHRGYPYEGLYIGMHWIYQPALDEMKCGHAMNVELDCSRDARTWTRVGAGQPFMPYQDRWDGWVVKPTAMLLVDDEIRIYYCAKGSPVARERGDAIRGWSTGVSRLRRDGFASINAEEKSGRIVTRPLGFSGRRLQVNATVEEGGSIRVGFRSTDNAATVSGRGIEDAVPIGPGDDLDRVVAWETGDDVSALSGTDARIEFELTRAKLYSFRVE
ncbi:MAG: hypothetical protein CMJ18_10625 [Phycisphaeraceae bacterium]|nr:hypothetical protein [Phycisphaeraceae bacterium]